MAVRIFTAETLKLLGRTKTAPGKHDSRDANPEAVSGKQLILSAVTGGITGSIYGAREEQGQDEGQWAKTGVQVP